MVQETGELWAELIAHKMPPESPTVISSSIGCVSGSTKKSATKPG